MARIDPDHVARLQTMFRASPYPAQSMTIDTLDLGSCAMAAPGQTAQLHGSARAEHR